MCCCIYDQIWDSDLNGSYEFKLEFEIRKERKKTNLLLVGQNHRGPFTSFLHQPTARTSHRRVGPARRSRFSAVHTHVPSMAGRSLLTGMSGPPISHLPSLCAWDTRAWSHVASSFFPFRRGRRRPATDSARGRRRPLFHRSWRNYPRRPHRVVTTTPLGWSADPGTRRIAIVPHRRVRSSRTRGEGERKIVVAAAGKTRLALSGGPKTLPESSPRLMEGVPGLVARQWRLEPVISHRHPSSPRIHELSCAALLPGLWMACRERRQLLW
jgi:hypothetical protein